MKNSEKEFSFLERKNFFLLLSEFRVPSTKKPSIQSKNPSISDLEKFSKKIIQSQNFMYASRRRPYTSRYPYRRTYRRTGRMPPMRLPRQPGISLARYQPALNDQDTYYTVQSREGFIDSNPGGVVSTTIAFAGVSLIQNWGSYSNIFDEFKVEAVRIQFTPSLPNSTTATFSPLYAANDSDGGIAPTSNADILSYGSVKTFDLNKPWSFTFTIPTTLEDRIAWYDVAVTTTQPNSIWLRAESLSISQRYGTVKIQYFVKFRASR